MPKVRFKPTLPYNSGADGGSVNHFDKPPLLPYLLTICIVTNATVPSPQPTASSSP